jgi:hypothetical protein
LFWHKWKKFICRLECPRAFCIVSNFLAIALNDEAFESNITSINDVTQLIFEKEKFNQPILGDIEEMIDGIHASQKRALGYTKCRDAFVRIGRVSPVSRTSLSYTACDGHLAGKATIRFLFTSDFSLPYPLGLFINANNWELLGALTPEERNQTVPH